VTVPAAANPALSTFAISRLPARGTPDTAGLMPRCDRDRLRIARHSGRLLAAHRGGLPPDALWIGDLQATRPPREIAHQSD
jgi:hypothetical protein